MISNNPTSILASFSTMKCMVDAKQYQSPYKMLAEFIQYIIIKQNLHSFTAIEMKNRLFEVFGFEVPEAVVRSTVRGLRYISTDSGTHHVHYSDLGEITEFEERKATAEADSSDIIDLLYSFVQKSIPSVSIQRDTLTKEFIAYLLDDQQTTASGKYTDLIGQFILKHEKDERLQSVLTAIREGSILYIGICYNINETGSLRKPLTLFLGTEVLFSLYGYNGEIYKQLAMDLFAQIKSANSGTQRISLRYFPDVKQEIDDFFTSAEYIVEGRQQMYDTVAMKAIINGCYSSGDVKVKKADFFHTLQYGYGIIQDERTNYYEATDNPNNLEDIENDPQLYEGIRLISNINKLRKGNIFPNDLDAEYLIVTNKRETLRASNDQVELDRQKTNVESACDYAVSVERLTNLLWYKMGNGLGRKEYPTNVSAILKARILLASKISHNISKLFEETRAKFRAGEITEEQLASRIITLQKKPIMPEELSSDTIEDSLNFSLEYLTRYEEEVNRNRDALAEKDKQLQALRDQNDKIRSEKDNEIAEKEQEIQTQQSRNAQLEAELAEYHRRDMEKAQRKTHRKELARITLLVLGGLILVALLILISVYVCRRIDPSITTAVSLVVGIIGIVPVILGTLHSIKKQRMMQ